MCRYTQNLHPPGLGNGILVYVITMWLFCVLSQCTASVNGDTVPCGTLWKCQAGIRFTQYSPRPCHLWYYLDIMPTSELSHTADQFAPSEEILALFESRVAAAHYFTKRHLALCPKHRVELTVPIFSARRVDELPVLTGYGCPVEGCCESLERNTF